MNFAIIIPIIALIVCAYCFVQLRRVQKELKAIANSVVFQSERGPAPKPGYLLIREAMRDHEQRFHNVRK